MLKVIIVNGYPRSGKDTLVDIAQTQYDCVRHSTVGKVKDMAKQMGWDGQKDEKSRVMLSELKDFYTKHFDGPFKDIVHTISQCTHIDFLFIFSREPEEIARVKMHCYHNGYFFRTILVNRTDSEKDHTSHSDKNVNNYEYDIVIDNNFYVSHFRFVVLCELCKLP